MFKFKILINRKKKKKKTPCGLKDASVLDHYTTTIFFVDIGHFFGGFAEMVMERRTDRPSYTDARTHLKTNHKVRG